MKKNNLRNQQHLLPLDSKICQTFINFNFNNNKYSKFTQKEFPLRTYFLFKKYYNPFCFRGLFKRTDLFL